MTLEATLICMDNTDWGRNGDFPPTRWDSLQETARLLFEAKLQINRESTVGLLSMGGGRVDVLATPCNEDGRLLTSIQDIKLSGDKIDLIKTVEISMLVLKHRPNKNLKQRIILLICSRLAEDTPVLIALAKKAKKNGVAIDVVNVGVKENVEKLQTFVETVNNADNSHLLHIDAGVMSVADVVISSPINSGMAAAAADIGGGAAGMVDPNQDPELAEAIRQSLEEQKAMMQNANVEQPMEEKKEEAKPVDEFEGLTEEEVMQRAILLSMEGKMEDQPPSEPQAEVAAPAPAVEEKKEEAKVEPPSKEDIQKSLLNDPKYVNEILQILPGLTEEERLKFMSDFKVKEGEKMSDVEPKKEDKKEEKKEDKPQ